MPQSLPISKHSLIQDAVSFTGELQKSLQRDSHASRSQSPVNAKAKTMNETYGLKRYNAFALYDHDTHTWRTSQASLLQTISEPFTETWPKQGIMLDGACWALTMFQPRTGVNGGGVWRSPSSQEPGIKPERLEPIKGGELGGMNRHFDKETGRMAQIGLTQQVAMRMWQTPNVVDSTGRQYQYVGKNREKFLTLPGQVKKWPTPSASERTNVKSGGHPGLAGGSGNRLKLYKMLGKEEGKKLGCQSLNPNWVEWLMGWPIGWTGLKPLAMDRFRLWLQQHGKY